MLTGRLKHCSSGDVEGRHDTKRVLAMKLDRSESVGGVSLIRVRKFLRGVRTRGCDEFELPELADFFRLEPPAAQELLAAMVCCGLVERPKVGPQGLRRRAHAGERLHALTREGIRLCNALFLP